MAECSRLERRPGLHTDDDVLFIFLANIRGRYLLENGNEKSLCKTEGTIFLRLIKLKKFKFADHHFFAY